MTTTLTYQQTADLLDLAVEAKGYSFVYPKETFGGCMYYLQYEGTSVADPACIVGWILNYVGITPLVMSCDNESGVPALVDFRDLILDLKTAALLYLTQDYQDSGVPWGPAVDLAKQAVRAIPEGVNLGYWRSFTQEAEEDPDAMDDFALVARYYLHDFQGMDWDDPAMIENKRQNMRTEDLICMAHKMVEQHDKAQGDLIQPVSVAQ